MAAATDSTLGTIILKGGDLLGTDATSPELVPTGVTPGDYDVAGVYVDIKGRVLYAKSIESHEIPCATTFSCGLVLPVEHIDIAGDSEISIPLATASDHGVVTIGSGFNTDGCEISVDYPIATTTTLGQVIVPTSGHLDVDPSGNISVPIADVGVLGVATIDPAGDLVMVGGDTLTAAPDLDDATTSSKGEVQIGDHFNESLGGAWISVDKASGDTTYGVVRSADTDHLTITAGEIDVGTQIPKLDTAQTWTKSQYQDLTVVSGSGTINVFGGTHTEVYKITLTGDATIVPDSPFVGEDFVVIIDPNGHTATLDSAFVVSSSPATVDGVSILCAKGIGVNKYACILIAGY